MKERKPKPQEHETTPLFSRWPGYMVAVAGTAVAALISWALQTPASVLPLYLAFFPAVFVAAMVGGTGPGVLATILSALTANLLYIEHGQNLKVATTAEVLRLGFFIATSLGISVLAGRFRIKSAMLRQNEARLRRFIDEAPVAIAMFDTQMRLIAVSRRWVADFSLANQNVLGRSHYEVFPDIPERWKQVHQRCLTGAVERADEDLFERADGSRQWRRWEVRPWYAAPGQVGGIVIFDEDVTARVKATEALRLSEERFHTMANAIPQLAWIARADGYLFWFNRRCYEYTGATLEQLEGWAWQSVVDPQLLPEVLKRWRRSINTGEPYEVQSRLRGADGRFHPVLTRVMPLKDKEGTVMLWFGTATDITELQQAQDHLEEAQDHLEEAVQERTAKLHEALAELEHMSYSMVHDMRAPLRAMQSYAELMQLECAAWLRPPALDYIHRIGDASNRLDRLITDALNYNKILREDLPVTPLDLGRLLRGMVQTYPNLHPPAADITIELDLEVLGNESLLTQCFGNLLDNAVKFVAPGVHPRVRIWAEELPGPVFAVPTQETAATHHEPSVIHHPSSITSPFVRIWVEDNGIGIPKEAQERIFRMFQRMHRESQYPGTGIGLTIVKKAVERMGGRICLESEPGKGTRFCVELPRPARGQNEYPLQHAA